MNDVLIHSFSDGPGVSEVDYCREPDDTGPTLLQTAHGKARRTAEQVVIKGAEQMGVRDAKELGAKVAASKASELLAVHAGAAIAEKSDRVKH